MEELNSRGCIIIEITDVVAGEHHYMLLSHDTLGSLIE